jgi:hypothetical protein
MPDSPGQHEPVTVSQFNLSVTNQRGQAHLPYPELITLEY